MAPFYGALLSVSVFYILLHMHSMHVTKNSGCEAFVGHTFPSKLGSGLSGRQNLISLCVHAGYCEREVRGSSSCYWSNDLRFSSLELKSLQNGDVLYNLVALLMSCQHVAKRDGGSWSKTWSQAGRSGHLHRMGTMPVITPATDIMPIVTESVPTPTPKHYQAL